MRDERLGPMGNSRYRAYADDIHNSARHLLNVINRVMDQRRAEIAGQVIERRNAEIDVGEVIGALVSSLAPLAERTGLRFEQRLQTPLPLLIADVTAVRQILLNLITNALKFTQPGGFIEVGASLDPGTRLVVWVRDDGPGLDPAVLRPGLSGGALGDAASPPGQDGAGLDGARLGATGLRSAGELVQSTPCRSGADQDAAAPEAESRVDRLPREAQGHKTAAGRAGGRAAGLANGLGLGLPTVAKLAGENQAEVSVYSTRGAGTCVEVAFPATRLVYV